VIIFEGHFKRNYIHLLDVCQAFELALSKPELFQGEIFNVGLSTANVSKLELCAVIKQRNPEFTYLEAPLGKDPDQRNYLVSNAKIESKGFIPKVNLESGIDELSKFIKMFDQRSHSNI
jgi:nucleoside-diphosphate-sugar epimerase